MLAKYSHHLLGVKRARWYYSARPLEKSVLVALDMIVAARWSLSAVFMERAPAICRLLCTVNASRGILRQAAGRSQSISLDMCSDACSWFCWLQYAEASVHPHSRVTRIDFLCGARLAFTSLLPVIITLRLFYAQRLYVNNLNRYSRISAIFVAIRTPFNHRALPLFNFLQCTCRFHPFANLKPFGQENSVTTQPDYGMDSCTATVLGPSYNITGWTCLLRCEVGCQCHGSSSIFLFVTCCIVVILTRI